MDIVKPYLFLDVDGVLNCIGGRGEDWDDFEQYNMMPFGRGPFRLYLSKTMCAELAALPVEIIWLTTWCEEAPVLIAPAVGFPEYPVAGFGNDLSGRKVSKQGCLEIWLEENGLRPFIWVDDDAIPHYATADFTELGWQFLFIKPNQYEGLTKAHIEEIQKFLKNLEP